MRDRRCTQIRRIDGLGKDRKSVQEIHVLRVVEKAENRLDFASPDAEPIGEFVISVSPVELRMPAAKVSQIPVVYLCACMKLIRDRHRDIQSAVGEREAALTGLHGEVVIGVRVREALGEEPMDLYGVSLDGEVRESRQILSSKRRRRCYYRGQKRNNPDLRFHLAALWNVQAGKPG